MEGIEFREDIPPVEAIQELRRCMGWHRRDDEATARALRASLYHVTAWRGLQAVGYARVVGDGATVFYIQDVIVRPECQGQGIGAALMERVMAYVAGAACENAVVGLMAAEGKEGFYQRYGFQARPAAGQGAGMTQFWKKNSQ